MMHWSNLQGKYQNMHIKQIVIRAIRVYINCFHKLSRRANGKKLKQLMNMSLISRK